MTIIIQRGDSTDEGTFSTGENMHWLELPWRDNSAHYSSIPVGTYLCRLEPSSKWSPRDDGRLYHVLDVPGRSLIKIHAATWAGDVTKGWHSDLLGCIAPGLHLGALQPPDVGKPQRCILSSRDALRAFMASLDGAEFELEIRD